MSAELSGRLMPHTRPSNFCASAVNSFWKRARTAGFHCWVTHPCPSGRTWMGNPAVEPGRARTFPEAVDGARAEVRWPRVGHQPAREFRGHRSEERYNRLHL